MQTMSVILLPASAAQHYATLDKRTNAS